MQRGTYFHFPGLDRRGMLSEKLSPHFLKTAAEISLTTIQITIIIVICLFGIPSLPFLTSKDAYLSALEFLES